MTYKAIPGPMNIQVNKGQIQNAMTTFQDIINREATGGWKYHSMEVISITEKAGCVGSPTSTNYYMLIFSTES